MTNYGKRMPGAKRKLRKPRYIKGYIPWCGIHKETQQTANRRARRSSGVTLEAMTTAKITPEQGKRRVASNRCGNECGRRAAMDDYLCPRCRNN